MRWASLRALAVAATAVELVAADSGTFFNPPGNVDYQPVWTLGEVQLVTWNSTFPACDVGYQASDSSYAIFFDSNVTSNSANWTVTIADSGSTNNSAFYYMIVQNSLNNSQYFYSTELDFVAPLPSQGASTTTAASTSGTAVTTVPTAHSTSFKTSTASATSPPTATSTRSELFPNNPTPSPPLSGGAIAGAVIGSIAGVLLLGALAFFLLRLRHRRWTPSWLARRQDPTAGLEPHSGGGGGGGDEKRPAELSPGHELPTAHSFSPPAEMLASAPVHELLGSRAADAPHELDASEAGDLEDPEAAMLGETAEGSSRRESRLASEAGEQRSPKPPVSPRTDGAQSPNPPHASSGTISPVGRGSGVVSDVSGGLGWG